MVGGSPPHEQSAEPRPDHAAEAERRVEAGHHGPPERGHEIHGGAVHGDVDPAVRGAEHEQDETEGERRPGEVGEATDSDRSTAVATVTTWGPYRRQSRPVSVMVTTAPHGHPEQGEAEVAGRGAGLLLDGGDPDDPAA